VEEFKLTTTLYGGFMIVGRVEYLLKLFLKNAIHWVEMNKGNIFKDLIQLMIKIDLAYKDDMGIIKEIMLQISFK